VYHVLESSSFLRTSNHIKAIEPDRIPARLLKEVAVEIAPAVTVLFQASLDKGMSHHHGRQLSLCPFSRKESFHSCKLSTNLDDLHP